ncbi:MAG: hypothetical protein QOH73_2100 [Gaiellaceae bacterium]|nr:hypothetical protein [Gaiellaceae bacterium]
MRYDDDTHEARLRALEARLAEVETRLRRLVPEQPAPSMPAPQPGPVYEAPVPPPPPVVPPAPVPSWESAPPVRPPAPASPAYRPLPPPPPPPIYTRPRRTMPTLPELDLEQLLGGRLFAWIGGVAILVGIAFFVATAMQRGWIPPSVRIALAFFGSAALFGVGVWLHEKRGQTQVSLVAIGTAIAALYASLVGATSLYHLIPTALALVVALLIGTVATAAAIRLESVQVAGLGILGALVAPVTVDAGKGWAALIFMGIALAASTGVLVWQRWDWLALLAYVASAPQLAVWMLHHPSEHVVTGIVALVFFWAIYVVAALGYELRVPTAALRASSAMLAVSNVIFTSGLGWLLLDRTGHDDAATAWVIAMAGLHVAGGALAALRMRDGREIPLLLVACGVSLSAIGLALALDGPWLVAGWGVEGALLAWISMRLASGRAVLGSLAFLGLAGGIALWIAIPGEDYACTVDAQERIAALLIMTVSALVASYCLRTNAWEEHLSEILEVGAALFALLALPIALSGSWLVAGLAVGATGLAAAAGRWSRYSAALGVVAWGGLALVLAVDIALPEEGYASSLDMGRRLAALLVVAAAALASSYLVRRSAFAVAMESLEALGAGLVLFALPIAFSGLWLVVAYSVGAVALAAVAGRWSHGVALGSAAVSGALALGLALHLAIVEDYETTVDWAVRIPALLVVAAAALAATVLLRKSDWGRFVSAPLEGIAAALVLLALPIALDGVWLETALVGGAIGLVAVAARWRHLLSLGAAAVWSAVALGLMLRLVFPEGGGYASTLDAETRIPALLVFAAGALAAAFLLRASVWEKWVAEPLQGLAAGLVLLALPIAFDGTPLVAALSVGAVLLAAIAYRAAHRTAGAAGVIWSLVALGHVLAWEATPRQALLYGVSASHALALALATAAVVGAVVLARNALELQAEQRTPFGVAGGLVLLYGLSGLVVAGVAGTGASTDGRSLSLSAFWSLVGVALFATGLSRDIRPVRLGGIALLTLAIAKVFLYDLASLGSLTRVASFIALGILLLAAAYAYQRQAARAEKSE